MATSTQSTKRNSTRAQEAKSPLKVREVSLRYKTPTDLTDAVLVVEKQKFHVSKMVGELSF